MRFPILFCMLIAHTSAEQWFFWSLFGINNQFKNLHALVKDRMTSRLNPEGGIFFLLYMFIQLFFIVTL